MSLSTPASTACVGQGSVATVGRARVRRSRAGRWGGGGGGGGGGGEGRQGRVRAGLYKNCKIVGEEERGGGGRLGWGQGCRRGVGDSGGRGKRDGELAESGSTGVAGWMEWLGGG